MPRSAGGVPACHRAADHLALAPACAMETGVRAGDAISPWYDPMIAKLVSHGPTRATALNALTRGLEATEVAGLTTNLASRRADPARGLCRGEVDTGLIAREIADLTAEPLCRPRSRPSQRWLRRAGARPTGPGD